ncbi:DUF6221 family protein [Paenarthrobacter sp. TAF1]|uniref:DUF6221 family protein n=1 Tax=Paenarthrobacter sp. TAF1 TaxID=3233067 RepID=UPI003F9A0583
MLAEREDRTEQPERSGESGEDPVASVIAFLEARLVEDEKLAVAASVSRDGRAFEDEWEYSAHVVGGDSYATPAHHRLMNAWWPGRVLAECAAKKAILDLYAVHREIRDSRRSPRARAAEDANATQGRLTQEARTRVVEDTLRALAAVYADHPDYQQEWVRG